MAPAASRRGGLDLFRSGLVVDDPLGKTGAVLFDPEHTHRQQRARARNDVLGILDRLRPVVEDGIEQPAIVDKPMNLVVRHSEKSRRLCGPV